MLQYFVAEAAVIGAWAGQQPYSRRTGYISDLGAVGCGVFDGRDVCSPAHVLMNASFVVQGIGMMVGALLLSSALLCTAARPGARFTLVPASRMAWVAAISARALTAAAGAGTVLVGLVPEDAGSVWHAVGAIMYFAAGGLALVLLGWLWLRQTPLSWPILACGAGVPRRPDHRRRDGDGRAGARHPGAAHGLPHHHRHGRRRAWWSPSAWGSSGPLCGGRGRRCADERSRGPARVGRLLLAEELPVAGQRPGP